MGWDGMSEGGKVCIGLVEKERSLVLVVLLVCLKFRFEKWSLCRSGTSYTDNHLESLSKNIVFRLCAV